MEKQLIMSLLIFISAYGFGQTTQNSAQKPVVKKTTTTTTKAKTTKAKKTKKTVSLTKGTTTANSKVQPKTMPKTTTARTNTTAPNSSMGTGHAISTGAPNSTGGKPHLGGDPGTGTITPVNPDPNANNNSIIPSDAASAIKQALSNGITTGVSKVSVTDGYFANNQIKIPFPQDASLVETTLREVGLGSMIDNVTLSINRAAESAAVQATPIFVNAIT
ncbi:MAG: hypothetical protein JWO06_3269 [Bacteroidota bacterium]|nr:hypothetical protein [Bacteroidota bacterium]